MRLHHLALRTRDVASLARFYERVFDLARVRTFDDTQGLRAAWLEAAGVVVMIERAAEAEALATLRTLDLVAFDGRGQSLAAWSAHLREHGATVEAATDFTLYFRDPDGRRVAISVYEFAERPSP